MANSTAFVLSKESQAKFLQYYREILFSVTEVRSTQRRRFERIDRSYQRTDDYTDDKIVAQAFNRTGDTSKLQAITIPITMPQVEAAVTYQTSVFLTGDPIFGVVSDAENMDAALQMETTLENNALRGGWTKEFMKHFRDGAKYNYAPLEASWETDKTFSIATDAKFSTNEGKPVETLWAGNSLKRLDPYNSFLDPTVEPSEVYKKGEFAGYTELRSRIALKQDIATMSDTITMNVKMAFESSNQGNPATGSTETSQNYYIPDINPDIPMEDNFEGNMNWMSWAELEGPTKSGINNIAYKNSYEKTTLYCKILPSEFALRVPAANTPQIWKLIFVNHQVIIHAERQTNAHGWIPILVGVPHEDGLSYQTKSLADNAEPFQQAATTHMSFIEASRRRAISDRLLYDPSRVTEANINAANPSAKIPVRPSAYGKPLSEAVYPFPYREDQIAVDMSQIRELVNLSNDLAGQNKASQGQFTKGNRTRAEFEDIQSNANNRDQMVSILTETQVMTPLKHIFKIDILQFQSATTIYSKAKKKPVDIDPVKLRNTVLEFRVSDGLIPTDKIIAGETLQVALQVMGASPQLGASYKVGELFSYLLKTQGADIDQFEKPAEQLAYEQAVSAWQGLVQSLIDTIGPEADIPANFPPQPLPEQFGYNPNPEGQGEGAEEEDRSQSVPQIEQGV